MFRFLKYLTLFIVSISIGYFYLFYTSHGQKYFYRELSQEASKRAGIKIRVKSIDIKQYPYVEAVLKVERKYQLKFSGYINEESIDMDYKILSECISSNICSINDDININGHIDGSFSKLNIIGEGKVLDGDIKYSGIKYVEKIEDVNISLKGVNSKKLFTLFGEETLIDGKADIHIDIKFMDEEHKKGFFTYAVKDSNLSGLPVNLYTKVYITDMKHNFIMDITSPSLTLNISKGIHNQKQNTTEAFYTLDIQDLSKLEDLLGSKYVGSFYALGEIKYHNHLKIDGLSKSLGGLMNFTFEKDELDVDLLDISFIKVMNLFEIKPMLKADITGKVHYYFKEEMLEGDTILNNAYLLPSSFVDVMFNNAGVNLLIEKFDKSRLKLSYHNNVIMGGLKLKNQNGHLLLTNVKMNTEEDTINAFFDFKVQTQEFSGKVYGTLSNPNINLNMQRLIQYQMTKQLDLFMGKKNRKDIEKVIDKMPMGKTAKDATSGGAGGAVEGAASFMGMFF